MIEYVTIDQAAELDAFVLRQPNCHFMQTSAWGRVKEGWGWTGILCRDEKPRDHRLHGHSESTASVICTRAFSMRRAGRSSGDGDLRHAPRRLIDAVRGSWPKAAQAPICSASILRCWRRRTRRFWTRCAQELGFPPSSRRCDYSLSPAAHVLCAPTLQGCTPESLADAYYSRTKRYDVRRADAQRRDRPAWASVADVPVFNRMMHATAAEERLHSRGSAAVLHARFLDGARPQGAQLYLAEKDGVSSSPRRDHGRLRQPRVAYVSPAPTAPIRPIFRMS